MEATMNSTPIAPSLEGAYLPDNDAMYSHMAQAPVLTMRVVGEALGPELAPIAAALCRWYMRGEIEQDADPFCQIGPCFERIANEMAWIMQASIQNRDALRASLFRADDF